MSRSADVSFDLCRRFILLLLYRTSPANFCGISSSISRRIRAAASYTVTSDTHSKRHTTDAVFTYCGMHFAPRHRRGIHALLGRHRHGRGPNPEATRPNRSAIIFYCGFATVKDKPSGNFRF
ncbi:MAG TPA: hypothetical protein VE396_17540 [Xanthobacteraceae bacterium]|jgi:hypothetical protein|nr:hypothetical protein [Xanthobacteraceae bacterium]